MAAMMTATGAHPRARGRPGKSYSSPPPSDVSREQERGRWVRVRATALEPQTLMSALLLCATLCQVSHQIYDPHSRTLPKVDRERERERPFCFNPRTCRRRCRPPARAAKLLRIKLYTQITSTPTLSHFAGAGGARHRSGAFSNLRRFPRRRGLVTGRI